MICSVTVDLDGKKRKRREAEGKVCDRAGVDDKEG